MTDPTGLSDLAPAHPEPSPEPAARGGSNRLLTAVAVLAGVFLIGAVAMAVLAAKLSSELHDERDDRRAVERLSSRFAEQLLTFDYRTLDDTRKAVFAMSTGKFQRDYDRAFRRNLKELLTAGKTVSVGTVTELFVGQVDKGSAAAIAVVDTSTRGAAGPRRSFDSYIELDLVKVDGRWLVDGVTNLSFTPGGTPSPVGAGGGGSEPASPSTTAP